MRSSSGRFNLGLGRSSKDLDDPASPTSHRRAASGGPGDMAKSVKDKFAHTTILPSILGNPNLKDLQELITNEKAVIQGEEKLATAISHAGTSLSTWGASQGPDLSDVLSHAEQILQHFAHALQTYAVRSAEMRVLFKNIRSREEQLDELLKKRKSTGNRAVKEEKKLAKMGQENKNLPSQTELLQSLRDQMRQMDTEIVTEEAQLGDFKRRITKEALGIKFGGCFELAEKAQIVGELGKLLIEEIPLEETPPGYSRTPYEGFGQTQRLAAEADRVIKEVVYHPPVVKLLPATAHQAAPSAPTNASPVAANTYEREVQNYQENAAAYGDDPHQSQQAPPFIPPERRQDASLAYQHPSNNVVFDAPQDSPLVSRELQHSNVEQQSATGPSFAGPAVGGILPDPTNATQLQHEYEYEQAQRAAEEERLGGQAISPIADSEEARYDDAYAADAKILPATHVYPVHASPAVATFGELGPTANEATEDAPETVTEGHLQRLGEQDAGPVDATAAPAVVGQGPGQQAYPFSLSERGSTRTLTIADWTIRSIKRPILNGKEIEAVTEQINIPLPEMTFGNNLLDLSYAPTDASHRPVSISFSATDALAGVAIGEGWEERVGGGVQVSMAEHWSQNRTQGTSYLSEIPISDKPTKPFDWTYSTTFAGDVQPHGSVHFMPSDTDEIPMGLLARQDPVLDQIIFYDDVSLFEDELHDNGESVMNIRIRVMPHSFFILSRLFLRVDNVLFRTHDVRIFHQFGTNKVIREVQGRECAYSDIKARLENPHDLSPLNDANFVTQILSSMPITSAGVGKPWPGLGVVRDVLRLDNDSHGGYPEQTSEIPVTTDVPSVDPKLTEEIPRTPVYEETSIPAAVPVAETVAQAPVVDTIAGPGEALTNHHQLTTAELQAQSQPKPSIMDRPRGVPRSHDYAGDGTFGGNNYAYDNNAYFVRNHASSPSYLPREQEVIGPEATTEPAIAITDTVGQQQELGLGHNSIQEDASVPRPTTAVHPGTGQRTISASAFKRNKGASLGPDSGSVTSAAGIIPSTSPLPTTNEVYGAGAAAPIQSTAYPSDTYVETSTEPIHNVAPAIPVRPDDVVPDTVQVAGDTTKTHHQTDSLDIGSDGHASVGSIPPRYSQSFQSSPVLGDVVAASPHQDAGLR